MNEKIEEIALRDTYREPVAKLKCLKGIETLTALSMVVEVEDSWWRPADITDLTGEWASAWWRGEKDSLLVLCRMRTKQANG